MVLIPGHELMDEAAMSRARIFQARVLEWGAIAFSNSVLDMVITLNLKWVHFIDSCYFL